MRTRLYFTSESHIHSTFNVLRWGHLYARTPGGEPCPSIFSDEARKTFSSVVMGAEAHFTDEPGAPVGESRVLFKVKLERFLSRVTRWVACVVENGVGGRVFGL